MIISIKDLISINLNQKIVTNIDFNSNDFKRL